jgi:hypothetical protein
MDTSHDDMDYKLLQRQLPPLLPPQDPDQMEVEVGLELEDAEHLVCGQSLQVDRAGIHCV